MKKYRGIQMHNFPKIFDCHCTSREKHLLLFQSGQTGQYVYLVLNINISEEKQTLPLWKEISENQCIFQFSTYNFQLKYIITRLLKCLLGLALLKTWGHLYLLTHFISYCDTIHNKNKKLVFFYLQQHVWKYLEKSWPKRGRLEKCGQDMKINNILPILKYDTDIWFIL